jgi:hypothetical protein
LELDVQQVKMFMGLEGETNALSDEINTWIRESGAKVLQISGNVAPQTSGGSGLGSGLPGTSLAAGRVPSDVLVIVLYEGK